MRVCKEHKACEARDFTVPVRIATIGSGKDSFNQLVSLGDITEGTVVWTFNSRVAQMAKTVLHVTKEELDSWPEAKRADFQMWCWQDDWNSFTGCTDRRFACLDRTNFLQHSCDPTCWFQGDGMLVARRAIRAGEPLSIEYASVDTLFSSFEEPCCCGTDKCRNVIRNSDFLNPAIALPYKGHMRRFLDAFWDKQ
jgi:hypothetical protein